MLKIAFFLVSYYKRLKTNAQNCIMLFIQLPTPGVFSPAQQVSIFKFKIILTSDRETPQSSTFRAKQSFGIDYTNLDIFI